MSLDSNRAEAEDAVSDLKDALCVAIAALDSLEGIISDAESLDNLDLCWTSRSAPDISDFISSLGFNYAEFSVTEILE
jgi:hypothetical protein